MKIGKYILTFALALVLAMASTALAFAEGAPKSPTIVDVAVAVSGGDEAGLVDANMEDFDTLVAAVVCTPGVADILSGRGQFTVFAPNDAAFDALNLNAANVCDAGLPLADILAYHAVHGNRSSSAVIGSSQLRTLQGGFLTQDGGFLNDSIAIIATDITAPSNGVIHVINGVLLP